MILLWCLTGVSLLAALVAWRRARQCTKRLEQLSQMYWELKYQHGELRVQVQRLTGEAGPPPPEPAVPQRPADGFVPLTSLKR